MGFRRKLYWLILVLTPLLLLTGCGDLEPEMQDSRTVSLNIDFHGKSSSRSSSSVSALMSYNAAQSYNDLSAKNKTLSTQYANSSSSSEKASYKSEYDSNASQMDSHESSFKMWDMFTLAGLGWGNLFIFNR